MAGEVMMDTIGTKNSEGCRQEDVGKLRGMKEIPTEEYSPEKGWRRRFDSVPGHHATYLGRFPFNSVPENKFTTAPTGSANPMEQKTRQGPLFGRPLSVALSFSRPPDRISERSHCRQHPKWRAAPTSSPSRPFPGNFRLPNSCASSRGILRVNIAETPLVP